MIYKDSQELVRGKGLETKGKKSATFVKISVKQNGLELPSQRNPHIPKKTPTQILLQIFSILQYKKNLY